MGRRGPAPTPTSILRLRGSWRGSANGTEPRPEPAKPDAPPGVEGPAKEAFDSLSAQLHAVGVVTLLDQAALGRYVVLLTRYRRCEEFLAKHGETFVVRGRPAVYGELGPVVAVKTYPQARQAIALADALLRLEREFGLTPAARARLCAPAEEEDPVGEDGGYFDDSETALA